MRRYPSTLPASLNSIVRRIQRLEAYGLPTAAESEKARQLLERMEAGRRRVAEARARGELPPHQPESGPYAEERRRKLVQATLEVLKRERERALRRRRR
jgi:hypothetical protein